MTAVAHRAQGYLASIINLVKVAALVLLSYLLQVCVVPYLKVGDVMPNLLMVCIAILTVAKGKKYAFASGAVFGILLESMASNLRLLNLLMYPALALLCAQVFADMSELRREMLRIRIAQRQADRGTAPIANPYRRGRLKLSFRRKTADDMDPHLRTLLNALMLIFLYEGIMIIYIALEGVSPTWAHAGRVISTLLYTAIASVLMFPARAFLNMYRLRRRAKRGEESLGEAVSISDRQLRQIALEPDMPQMSGVEPLVSKKNTEQDQAPEKPDVTSEPTEESANEPVSADAFGTMAEEPEPTDSSEVTPVPDAPEENKHEDREEN